MQEHLFVGAELHGRKGDDLCPCKILKVVEEGTIKTQYEVAWLDKNKKITETALLNGDDLIWKKFPFSRGILKSFVRKSTYRSAPWVLHNKLAQKHGISSDPPQDLKGKVFIQDGLVRNKKKSAGVNILTICVVYRVNDIIKLSHIYNVQEVEEEFGIRKKKRVEGEKAEAANVEKDAMKGRLKV